jgi:hypothetical protein
MTAAQFRRPSVAIAAMLITVTLGMPLESLAAPTKPAVTKTAILQDPWGSLDIAAVKAELTIQAHGHNRRLAKRARHLLDMVAIVEAPTREIRHELIRKLPVAISMSPAVDGRSGTIERLLSTARHGSRPSVPLSRCS